MLKDKSDSKPTANAADDPTNSNISQYYTDTSSITDATDSSDFTILLAPVFNIMGDHTEAKETVAAALMALSQP